MKDRFTLFAILGALGCVFVSMFLEGSNPMVLFVSASSSGQNWDQRSGSIPSPVL
jgi:hypothetical protein